jgi:hypothetical protein
LHCRGGGADAYERAIGRFLADRSAMESRDVRRCYVALAASLASLPRDVRPQTLHALQEQLARDTAPGAIENALGEASRCLATLLIMRGQLAAARDVKDQKGRPLLRGQFGNQAARLLVAQGMYDEAAAISSQSLGDIAAAHLAAGRHHQALLILERLEHDGGGGTATMAACQFAEHDDWDRAGRAVATIGDGVSRGSCLTELAAIAVRKGRLDRVMPLLHAARERLHHIADLDSRSQAAEYLACAYNAAGDARIAWELVNREGDDLARAKVLVDMAGHQLSAKDATGFLQSMERLDSILAKDRLHVSRTPEVGDSPEWRGPRQVAFALMAARLHLRAGDKARAGEAIRSGFARAGNPPGIAWRTDVYFETLVDAKPTSEALAEIADLVELAPSPTDRAMLAIVGSAMAAEMKATR